ncbi:hypothetical protein CYJ76_06355 [Kytococcus schroeteri]|uniref:Uncharacterized protein n=1 Tax=Kytococcus schroeteri TaxID=138300 RepID=A0A2I1PAR9_9MICO|nr:hypothetical protein CYJ76_06355 [Kytococcus schroeteri]
MDEVDRTAGVRQAECVGAALSTAAPCVGCGAGTGGPGTAGAALDAREQEAVAALVRSGLVGLGTALGARAEVLPLTGLVGAGSRG